MNITYEELTKFNMERIKIIYKSCGWVSYLKDDEKLSNAFSNTLFLYGAYHNDELVGFIRCVGDGEHIVLVQDLILHSDYQKNGIGTHLFNFVIKKYEDIRMLLVITDMFDEVDNKFYQNNGLTKIIEKQMVAYIK